MRYFYDHQTDTVSFFLRDFIDYGAMEEVVPGIVAYFDRIGRPMALEVRDASNTLDTTGLAPMFEQPIEHDEISRRLSFTDKGQLVWRAVMRRTLVPNWPSHAASRASRCSSGRHVVPHD